MDQAHSMDSKIKKQAIKPWVVILLVLVVILLVLVVISGALIWWLTRNINSGVITAIVSPKPSATISSILSPTATPSPSPSQTPAATPAASTYTNSKYGFSLTFPGSWTGYKMVEKTFSDSVITYYVNVPTADTNVTASDFNDAGYYSPFAITVYTLAQWDDLQAQEGPKDALLAKNETYAFGWSPANGIPPSDWGNKNDDTLSIIETFKLN